MKLLTTCCSKILPAIFSLFFAFHVCAMQPPSVDIIGKGPLVPQSKHQSIPVSYMNLKEVDIEVLRITDFKKIFGYRSIFNTLDSYSLNNLHHSFESVFSDRYTLPKIAEDKPGSTRLPIPKKLPSGWYIVVVKAPGEFYHLKIRHMLLTDIGVQATISQQNYRFLISRMSTGAAIANAQLDIYEKGKPTVHLKTDADGNATYQGNFSRSAYVIVKTADGIEESVLPLRENALDLSDNQIGGPDYRSDEAFIYSNRDLVKPGESLPLHVLLRNEDGIAERDQAITLKIYDPRQRTLVTQRLEPEHDTGYFHYDVKTSSSWTTGRYRVEAFINGNSNKVLGSYSFQLEEFTPERMELTIDDLKPWLPVGGDNTVNLSGRYLFGSPAAHNELSLQQAYTPIQHWLAGPYKEYYIGQKYALSTRYKSIPRQSMDKEGHLKLKLSTPEAKLLKGPIRVDLDFSLYETGGKAVQRKAEVMAWKNQNIPGILPLSEEVDWDASAEFNLALFAPDGMSRKAGQLKYWIEHDRGRYYWTYEDGEGWVEHEQDRWEITDSQTISVAAGKSVHVQTPVTWGRYKLIVEDASNSDSRTEYSFYAGWWGNKSMRAVKPDHLKIYTKKSAYRAGETAKVLVEAPVSGHLWINLESDHQLWSKKIAVEKGKQTINMPVSKQWARHDLYLTATLLGNVEEVPKRYFGISHFKLDRGSRKLSIKAKLPQLLKPSSHIKIPVSVANIAASNQENTWVTVSVVDQGILHLSRYQPTNPFDFFFAQRRFSGDVIDLYSRVYDTRPDPFATPRFGSDLNKRIENINDNMAESKSVMWMSKAVKVKNGKVEVPFDMPDYNGEVQLVVTAFNDSQSGQMVEDHQVHDKLIAELSVPNFLIPGDETSINIDLFNTSGKDLTLDLDFVLDDKLRAKKEVPESIHIKDKAHWSMRVPLDVVGQPMGQTLVHIKAKHQTDKDINLDRSWHIPIETYEPWIGHSRYAVIKPNETVAIDEKLWDGLRKNKRHLGTLTLTQFTNLGLATHIDELLHYPYGCTEQTISGAWPFLLNSPQLDAAKDRALKYHRKSGESRSQAIETMMTAVLAKLKRRQLANGGMALWDNDQHERFWLTAYTADFIIDLSEKIPQLATKTMKDKLLSRLENWVRNPSQIDNIYACEAAFAYAAYVLSTQGRISLSDLANFGADKIKGMNMLIQHQLAYAYAKAGDIKTAKKLLQMDVKPRTWRYYYADYGSSVRDNSIASFILHQLIAMPDFTKLAGRLLIDKQSSLEYAYRHYRWLSTQDRFSLVRLIIALDADMNRELKVKINDKEYVYQGYFSKRVSELYSAEQAQENKRHPFAAKAKQMGFLDAFAQMNIKEVQKVLTGKSIKITNLNKMPIYLNFTARGHLKFEAGTQNPSLNTIANKHVIRQYYSMKGEKIRPSTLHVGDRIIAVVDIDTEEDLNDVLLEEYIPAGFVLENPALNQGLSVQGLLPSSIKLTNPAHTEYRHDRFVSVADYGRYGTYRHAYILRAEVPGTYVVPPIKLEAMFRPEKHVIKWADVTHMTIVP